MNQGTTSSRYPIGARGFRRLGAFAGAMLCAISTASAASHPPVTSVWKEQHLEFTYRADQMLYTCRNLASRVASILQAVGARHDLQVGGVCVDYARRQSLTIAIHSPVEASPENLANVITRNPTQRLLDHLRGEPASTPADVERFEARWTSVALARGDCELVQAITEQLLPHLSVRQRKSTLSCDASSRVEPLRRVEALIHS